MGTSGRRTPPAPVSAGPPKGARTAFAACQKLEKALPVSRGLRIFLRLGLFPGSAHDSVTRWKDSEGLRGSEGLSKGERAVWRYPARAQREGGGLRPFDGLIPNAEAARHDAPGGYFPVKAPRLTGVPIDRRYTM